MSVTTVEYDLADLLRRVGARVRGKRADCPWCRGRRTISHTDQVYFCHRCGAKGNAFTLARDLGLAPRLSPADARAFCLERERAEAAANAFLALVQKARFGLDTLHIALLNLGDRVHERLKANHEDETAWDVLAYLHAELPRIRAQLTLLSHGTVGDRLAWLEADNEARRDMANRILWAGGVPTFDEKWAEVCDP